MIILQTVGGISLPQRFIFLSVGKVYGDNEALNEIPFSVCLIKFSVLFIHAPRYLFRLTLARRQVFFPSIWAIDSARTPFLYRWNMNTRKQRNTTTNTTVKMRKALKEKEEKKKRLIRKYESQNERKHSGTHNVVFLTIPTSTIN